MAVKRALISVSDKTGVVEFAQQLEKLGVEILSTGGTAKALRDSGVKVIDVSEYTESPEVMDGRVKTLHPRVHGGLLSREGIDEQDLQRIGAKPIDLVAVNLYPFQKTLEAGAEHVEVIENIDIGGPSMVRSAAKNHSRVSVVVDPKDYQQVISSIQKSGQVPDSQRAALAAKAFSHTAAYDALIAQYLQNKLESKGEASFPESLTLTFRKAYDLRYGENPHQSAAFYTQPLALPGSLATAQSIGAGGKELSFNNLVDCEAAIEAAREFEGPAAVVIKHTNPCGVAQGITIEQAFRAAREADALSAFGGIVALNRPVDVPTAKALIESFLECVIAPSFEAAALEVLHTKNNLRVLATDKWLAPNYNALDLKRISGGLVVQQRDNRGYDDFAAAKVVSKRVPTEAERQALEFAWIVCKHVKSNAIVFATHEPTLRTVGVGAGQMSRVVSVELAASKAGQASRGAVMASDAFFPFADGVEAAAAAGVTAVVQPGGSKRDAEVIAAADAANIAMLVTGYRHFRH